MNALLTLLEHSSHPRSTIETLLQASRQLRLPVDVDRRLGELTSSDLDPREVVRQLVDFLKTSRRIQP